MFGGDDGDAERLEPATWTLRAAEEQRCALDDDEGPPSDAVGGGDARQDRGQWQAQSNGQSRGRRGEPAPARSPREPQERSLHVEPPDLQGALALPRPDQAVLAIEASQP